MKRYIFTLSRFNLRTKEFEYRYVCDRHCWRREDEYYDPCVDRIACRCQVCGIWANE